MAEQNAVKTYPKNNLTVRWESAKCIHSENCWKGLSSVFNPQERPWINVDGASAERIAQQIDQCPSGALSYTWAETETAAADSIKVQILPDGPVLIRGDVEVTHADGSSETNSGSTAFCRCGASASKPYCDGSHKRIGFRG